jgi:hypothetical protein
MSDPVTAVLLRIPTSEKLKLIRLAASQSIKQGQIVTMTDVMRSLIRDAKI